MLEVHVAGIVIRRRAAFDEVLLCRRARTLKHFPSLWEGFGGRLYANESFEQAPVRKAMDELGLVVTPAPVPGIPYHFADAPNTIPGLWMLCRTSWSAVPVCNPEIHSEFAWVPCEHLEDVFRSGPNFIPGFSIQVLTLLYFHGLYVPNKRANWEELPTPPGFARVEQD